MSKSIEAKSWIRSVFEQISPLYEKKANPRYTKLEAAILQEWLADLQGILLDVGAGTGRFLEILLEGREVIGIDISRRMMESAKDKGCELSIVGDAEKMPLLDNSVDLVTVIEVIQYMPNPEFVINEIWRVLKEDGCGLLAIPNTFWYLFLELLGRLRITNWPEFTPYTMSLSSYENMLKSRGFEIDRVEGIRYLPILPPIARVLQVRKKV